MRNVASLLAGLYSGIVSVVAIRDSNNQLSTDELPPVLPHSLATIIPAKVTKLILFHRGRLVKAGWSEAQIEKIEQDHHGIRYASSSEALFKELWGKCSYTATSFDKGWGVCHSCFDSLRQFAGGLASMFPNIASVELERLCTSSLSPIFRLRIFSIPSNFNCFVQCQPSSLQSVQYTMTLGQSQPNPLLRQVVVPPLA